MDEREEKLIKECCAYRNLLVMYMEHEHDELFMSWWLEKVKEVLEKY